MSFRIDDILKRETSSSPNSTKCENPVKEQPSPSTTPPTTRDQKTTEPWFGLSHTNSILQQTLLNRSYPYYRSVSDCPNSKMYSAAFYNCDKVFMPFNHLDPYVDKVSAFSSVYSRNRYWPMYPLTHPVVLPLPYTHYSKRKGGQVRFTASQTDALEKRFSAHKYLSPEDRRVLADSLKLTDRQVKTWFQNRRAKWRRCNVSGNDKTHENNEESEPETDICDDDTPRHEKSNTIIK